jgi:hypothetical protein
MWRLTCWHADDARLGTQVSIIRIVVVRPRMRSLTHIKMERKHVGFHDVECQLFAKSARQVYIEMRRLRWKDVC